MFLHRPTFVVKPVRNRNDEVAMRAVHRAAPGEAALAVKGRLRLAALVLDLDARELRTADDQPVVLRAKSLEVLLLLAEHAGHVLDKATLMDRVWPGVVVGDDSLTQTVVEIRRALGDHARQVLCTVPRRGYRLLAGEVLASALPPPLSVAVLPIAYDSAEPGSARLAAALTSELTSRAGIGLPDSMVAARETVASLGAALDDPRCAAQQLGVQQVMCGDLRAVTSGWSLWLAVVDGVSGARRWSHRFALADAGLPEQIDLITAQAARALFVEMHRTAAVRIAARSPQLRSAGDFALQGWASIYDGISPSNLEQAQHFFEQAVAEDPAHRSGLGGLCVSMFWRAELGWAPDRILAERCVLDTAARLEKLYPDDTLTALASGSAANLTHRWDLRLTIGDRLCKRDPDSPTSHFSRAVALIKLGRFDACVAEVDLAHRLSLDDFRAGWWLCFAACAHLMAGRHNHAAHAAQHAIAANACLPLPPLILAAALAGDGRVAEGREVLRQHLVREPGCGRLHVTELLSDGLADYQQGCRRILATLETLGLSAS